MFLVLEDIVPLIKHRLEDAWRQLLFNDVNAVISFAEILVVIRGRVPLKNRLVEFSFNVDIGLLIHQNG